MKHTTIRQSFVLALAVCVMIAFSAMVPGGAAFAAKKYKLPTKATVYNGKGKVIETTTYQYDKKGNLIKQTSKWPKELEMGDDVITIIKYKYKKGKPVSATAKSGSNDNKYTFDKNGNISYVDYAGETVYGTYKNTFDKKGNIKKCIRSLEYDGDEEETNTLKYTYKGSKRTVTTKRARGKTARQVSTYNKNGLLTKRTDNGVVYVDYSETYTYKMKNGLVMEKTITDKDNDKTRTVYKYGKTKVSKTAYNRFMNRDENSVLMYIYE